MNDRLLPRSNSWQKQQRQSETYGERLLSSSFQWMSITHGLEGVGVKRKHDSPQSVLWLKPGPTRSGRRVGLPCRVRAIGQVPAQHHRNSHPGNWECNGYVARSRSEERRVGKEC